MNNTKQYAVQCNLQTQTVRRGQIRLLRPPWWDELSDFTTSGQIGLTATTTVNPTPIKYEVAAADANTIRSIVNNSASSSKSLSHHMPHHLPIINVSTATVAAASLDIQANMSGSGCNKSLTQRSRMSYSVSKFEPISKTHTSTPSVRLFSCL